MLVGIRTYNIVTVSYSNMAQQILMTPVLFFQKESRVFRMVGTVSVSRVFSSEIFQNLKD